MQDRIMYCKNKRNLKFEMKFAFTVRWIPSFKKFYANLIGMSNKNMIHDSMNGNKNKKRNKNTCCAKLYDCVCVYLSRRFLIVRTKHFIEVNILLI